jgi:hypothetical protein
MSDTGRLNKRAFANYACDRVAEIFPDATCAVEIEERVHSVVVTFPDTARIHLSTGSFYHSYYNHGDLERALRPALDTLREQQLQMDNPLPTFAELADRIYPKIERKAVIAARGEDRPKIPAMPFVADDLGIVCVVDSPDSVRFVMQTDLDRWEMDIETLHTHAMGNLRQRAEQAKLHHEDINGTSFWFSQTDDGFDAARMLCWDVFGFTNPGRLVFAIPTRDLLIVTTMCEGSVLPLAFLISKSQMDNPYNLTRHLFTIKHGGSLSLLSD